MSGGASRVVREGEGGRIAFGIVRVHFCQKRSGLVDTDLPCSKTLDSGFPFIYQYKYILYIPGI